MEQQAPSPPRTATLPPVPKAQTSGDWSSASSDATQGFAVRFTGVTVSVLSVTQTPPQPPVPKGWDFPYRLKRLSSGLFLEFVGGEGRSRGSRSRRTKGRQATDHKSNREICSPLRALCLGGITQQPCDADNATPVLEQRKSIQQDKREKNKKKNNTIKTTLFSTIFSLCSLGRQRAMLQSPWHVPDHLASGTPFFTKIFRCAWDFF